MAVEPRRPLGETLVRAGLIDHVQLRQVLSVQQAEGRRHRRVGRVAVDAGYLDEEQLARALALHLGLPFVDLEDVRPDERLADILPPRQAAKLRALPLRIDDGDRLVVAVSDPTHVVALDDLRLVTRREIQLVVAGPTALAEALLTFETFDRSVQEMLEEWETDERDGKALIDGVASAAPLVRAVDAVIEYGILRGASDIHIDAGEHSVVVRYRLDGVLMEGVQAPTALQGSIVSRIKVMSDLDPAEHRRPQDGRFTATVDGSPVDVRVATLPSQHGEQVTLRLLHRASAKFPLKAIGFSPDALQMYHRVLRRLRGGIFVVGPTGSGKTTTLYSSLNLVSDGAKSVVTVEDPVEYRIPGLCQVQVLPETGLTFATALRAILRCDPDVVMVGEIRDGETAQIAIEATLTGHLVLSTLHAKDATSALPRLMDLGVEPYIAVAGVDLIVAQRLVRKLCTRCREQETPSRIEIVWKRLVRSGVAPPATLFRAVGCANCANTGYRGRIAVVELLPVTEETRRLVLEDGSVRSVRAHARANGMVTLLEDGLRKVRDGLTTIQEVFRVLSDDHQIDGVDGERPRPHPEIVGQMCLPGMGARR